MQFEAFVPALMEHDAAPLIFAAHNGDRHASSPQLEHSSTPVSVAPLCLMLGWGHVSQPPIPDHFASLDG